MPATYTSILGTDLISASRAVINANFQAVQTAKADLTSPSLIGVPNAITGSYLDNSKMVATNEFVQQAMSSVAGTPSSIFSIIPNPVMALAATPIAAVNLDNNQMLVNMVNIPNQIVVNQTAIEVTTVISGGMRVTMWNETGTASVLTTGTGTLVGSGVYTCSLVSAKTLAPGNYWVGINDTNNNGNSFRVFALNGATELNSSVAGKLRLSGLASIATGIPSSVLQFSQFTTVNNGVFMRLDN